MKELSELAMRRRVVQQRIADRTEEIKVFQNEYDKSTSTKRKRTLLQRIDKMTNQLFNDCDC